jgi:hypothetical protein
MARYLSPVRYICVALISSWVLRVEAVQLIQKDWLDTYIEQVTGHESVVNCGEYALGTTHSKEALIKSLTCAEDSAHHQKPFRIVVHMAGEDSSLAEGLLSDAAGRVFFFEYDSAPCGGPGCAPRFDKKACRVSDVHVVDWSPGYYRFEFKPH